MENKMKLLTKMTLIGGAIVFVLTGCNDRKAGEAAENLSQVQQEAYAMGSSFSTYIKRSLDAQQIKLDPEYVTKGFHDTYYDKSQLTNEQVEKIISELGNRIQKENKERIEKEAAQSIAAGDKFRQEFAKEEGVKKTPSGLLYKIVKPGKGKHPTMDSTVVVNYTGKLIDGREFDSSYRRNEPATFPLLYVIKGWSEGLQLIGQGGELKLVVPPELAYGEQSLPAHGEGSAPIPSQSTLVFDIKLIKIEKTDKSNAKETVSDVIDKE